MHISQEWGLVCSALCLVLKLVTEPSTLRGCQVTKGMDTLLWILGCTSLPLVTDTPVPSPGTSQTHQSGIALHLRSPPVPRRSLLLFGHLRPKSPSLRASLPSGWLDPRAFLCALLNNLPLGGLIFAWSQNLLMELHTGQTSADRECAPEVVADTDCTRAGSQHTAVNTPAVWTAHPSAGFLEEQACLQAAAL